ncbi:MAG TPA: pentapeptide repeat-containing protein [Polyangiaceae bacterium]
MHASPFTAGSAPAATGSSSNAPIAGETILGVRLVEMLGRGPNGTVWTARDAEGKTVAVKIARAEAAEKEAVAAAFRRGVETMSRASEVAGRGTTALARLHAISPDGLAFTFDYYDNGSAAGIPSLAWNVQRTLEFFGRICRAVAGLHEVGLLHRALKPSNVLVDDALAPVLVDAGMLGVSEPGRPLDAADATYRAPEELGGEVVQSPTADVYGLGRVLWFLLQGSDPDEPYDAFAKLASLERFPPGLVRIIRKATAHDPAARYQWVEELEADIARYLTPELVGIGKIGPGEAYPRHCVSSLPAAPRKSVVDAAPERRATPRLGAPVERSHALVRAGAWVGLCAVVVSALLLFVPSVPSVRSAAFAGAAMTLGLALSTLFLPAFAKNPLLARVAAFGAVLAVALPLEPDRLVLFRWRVTLDRGSDEARARAARLLARAGARDLSGARLARSDLARADLGRADLRGSNLAGANLAGANLAESNLAGADLSGADLRGATLLSSNPGEARGFSKARCSRSTAMPAGWSCFGESPASAGN